MGDDHCRELDTSPEGDYPITILLIITNIIVYLLIAWKTNSFIYITDYPENTASTLTCAAKLSCPLAILGSMFTHAGIAHLLGNMYFLYLLGDNVEVALGSPRFLVLYLVSGYVATIIQSVVTLGIWMTRSPVFLVGASGAISGVIGAYLIIYPRAKHCICLFNAFCTYINSYMIFTLWILLQILFAILLTSIGGAAHLSGLLIGGALTFFLVKDDRLRQVRMRLALGMSKGKRLSLKEMKYPSNVNVLMVVILISGLILAFLTGISTYRLYEIKNWGYSVQLAYRSSSWSVPTVLPYSPSYGTGTNHRVLVDGRIVFYPGNGSKIISKNIMKHNVKIVTIEKGEIDDMYLTAAVSTITILLSTVLTLAAFSDPDRFEATYLPEELYRRLYSEEAGV